MVALVVVALPVMVRLPTRVDDAVDRNPPLRVERPDAVMVPMFTRLPDESMRLVPPDAPVLIAVVPFMVVPVMVLAVAMVPKPDAIEPEDRAPTVTSPAPEVTDEFRVVAVRMSAPLIL